MINQTIQTIENIENNVRVPLHIFEWVNSQLSIIQKAHKINRKEDRFEIAKNFIIVKR